MPYTENSSWTKDAIERDHEDALRENYLRTKSPCARCGAATEFRHLDEGWCDGCIEQAALDVVELANGERVMPADFDWRDVGLEELRGRAAERRYARPATGNEIRYGVEALVRW